MLFQNPIFIQPRRLKETTKKKKSTLYPGIGIVNAYTLIAALYCAFSAILFYYVVENVFLAIIHLLALLSIAMNYLILIQTKEINRATNVILTTGTIVVLSLFATGGWANTGYLWPFAFLPFLCFLSNRAVTMNWVAALLGGCLAVVLLHFTGAITIPYSPAELVNYFAALLVFIVCIFLFQKATVKREEFLSFTETLLEAAPDPVIVIDDEGRVVKWNAKSEALFGWTAEEVFGKLLSEIIIPYRYREAHSKGLKHFLKTGEWPVLDETIEIQAINKNNVEFDIALSISPAIVQNKQFFIGFVRDITERNTTEEKIREKGNMFSTLFYKSPVMKAIIEASTGKYIEVNDAFVDFVGNAKENILGKTSLEIDMFDHPENGDQMIKSIQKNGFVRELEMQLNSRDGKASWISINVDMVNLNGKDCFLSAGLDITKRKIAEENLLTLSQELEAIVFERTEELNRSEKSYRYLFENNPMPMWVIELNTFKFLDINEMAILQYGYSRQEFLSMTTLDIRADEGKELFTQPDHMFEMSRTNYSKGIWDHRKKDGTIIQVETIGHKIIFEGVPARLILSNDITEKKKAEEKLKQSEKKLRALIENSNEAIIINDSHGKRIFASEGINRMLGFTPEEFMQLSIFEMVPPDEAHSVRLVLQKATDNPHQPFTTYFHIRHKNGSWRWIEAVLAGYFDVPDLNGIVITYRDVTERKEAEERMKTTLKELSDYKYALDESSIVAITDQNGIIRHVNDNFCKISKYSREELIGQDHQIINSGHHPKELIRDLWITIANGKIWKCELKNKAKDGTVYWVDTTIIPFLNEENKPYQYVAIKADITERKLAEQALHESRQLLTAIIDNSPTVIYVKNLQGRYLLANRLFSELFHLGEEVILGKTDYDFFPKEEADMLRQMDVRTAAADHPLTEEETVPLKDGLHTYISVKSTLRDDTGMPYAIFGISTDITDRKKVEEAILRAETNYREIFDKASDAIYVHEMETGKVIQVNQKASKITGYTKEELLNTDPQEFITDNPDYTLQHAMKYLQKAAAGEPQLFEWLSKKKDASPSWLEVNLKKATIAGQERILAFFREINDRKKAQLEIQKLNEGLEQKVVLRTAELQKSNELFFKLFNHNPASIAISNITDGNLINVNDGFLLLNGYSSKEEVIGKTIEELNMPVQLKQRIEVVRLLKENKNIKNLEINIYDKQGNKKWIQLSAIILEVDNVSCLLSVSIDITERKKAEEQLMSVNNELEAFSYSVSHDLRAPLRAINGFAKILEENYSTVFDNEGQRLFNRIKVNAKKMGFLIDDLLEFSRLGRKEIHKSPIQMTQLVEATLVEINATTDQKAAVKINRLHSANADSAMIKQVMINLLSNAIKYSSKTENPSIEIKSHLEENEIIYSVSDNGVGFNNQYAHKLFGVFQRLHKQSDFEGTGVGLALVKRIINKHGGRVWAAGELNKGATFCFSLPAIKNN